MELKCVFKMLSWQGNRKLYTCIIKEASIVEKETEIAEINGKHFSLSKNNEVQGIKFKNPAVIEFFPRGLCKIFPRLKGIDITDCGLKELTRDDLVGLKNLEILLIQSNQLSSLPDDLFTGMKELKKISFWDNKLHLTSSRLLQPICDNELDFVDFRGNENITCFYNKTGAPGSLKTVKQMMATIESLCLAPKEQKQHSNQDTVNISCNFTYIEWRDEVLYTCKVTAANFDRQGIEIKSTKGNHMIKKKNKDVLGIDFTQQIVWHIPRGLNIVFPGLIAVDIEECGLKMISSDDMKGLQNLEEFYAGKNLLTSLPDDLFEEMPKLRMISFNSNKLERMSSKLLLPIFWNQPVYVDFRENKSIDAFYEPGRRKSVESLKKLMEVIDVTCSGTSHEDNKVVSTIEGKSVNDEEMECETSSIQGIEE